MVSKILDYFGRDGLAHMVCCAALVGVLGLFLALWVAVVVTAAIGIGKELVWDRWMGKGTCEWRDLLADVAGMVIGML